MVKGRKCFLKCKDYGAFVYPLPRVGAGWCSHSALKYVPCASKYLSPTQRNPQLLAVWPGTENRDMSAEDLPHLCLPTAVWRVKVIVFSAQSSAFCLFASDFTLCSAYSAKGKLEWSIPPTSPRTQSSSGHGGTSCLGDSSEHSGQVLPGLHPICQNLPGATLATSLFSLCRGLGTASRLACWYVPHLLKEEIWANYPFSPPTLGYCQLTSPFFTILIRTALSNYKCIHNHFWETVQSNLSGRRLFLQF